MSRPLKVFGDSLKEMTDSEMDYVVYRVLKAYAAKTSGIGVLQKTTTTTNMFDVGTLTNTQRTQSSVSDGAHPVDTAFSTTYHTFKMQNAPNNVPTGHHKILSYDTTNDRFQVQRADNELEDHIIRLCIEEIKSGGIGSWYLGESAPSGGTWTAKHTIPETRMTGTGVITRNFYLYQKTDDTAPSTTVRPVAWHNDGIREMTDAQMNTLCDALQWKIISSGVGTYNLSSTPNPSGTWVQVGTPWTDRRRNITDIAYNQPTSYVGTYRSRTNYTQFADYTGNYYQYADYRHVPNYRTTIAYRARVGYVINYGTYYRYANYYRFANYFGTYADYRATVAYSGTYTAINNYYQFVNYDGTYTQFTSYYGQTAQSTYGTIETKYLWKRTA